MKMKHFFERNDSKHLIFYSQLESFVQVNYDCPRLQGGSPDVVHLLKYSS